MRKHYLTVLVFAIALCTSFSMHAQTFSTGKSTNQTEPIEDLRVYPNPVMGNKIYITSKEGKSKIVTVFNVLGDKVLFDVLVMNSNELDISTLSPGVYVVRIKEEERTTSTKLVIK